MATGKTKTSLPLDAVCMVVAESLPSNEYLIDRHSIVKGEDYSDISVIAKWSSEYETISVELVFLVSADQKEGMQSYIDDDDVRDDIDSGVGELFENALQAQFPGYDWSFPIGEVKIECKKVKR